MQINMSPPTFGGFYTQRPGPESQEGTTYIRLGDFGYADGEEMQKEQRLTKRAAQGLGLDAGPLLDFYDEAKAALNIDA